MNRSVLQGPAIALAFLVCTVGCGSKTPVEKAGAAVDRAAHDTGRALEHAAEKTGDAIDNAAAKTEKALK